MQPDYELFCVNCFQGHKQWVAEVHFLGVVEHPNLVKLIGYCAVDGERGIQRLLVYEYMPNKSLEDHLFSKAYPALSWDTRLQIVLGAAQGLVYLHEEIEIQVLTSTLSSRAFCFKFSVLHVIFPKGSLQLHHDEWLLMVTFVYSIVLRLYIGISSHQTCCWMTTSRQSFRTLGLPGRVLRPAIVMSQLRYVRFVRMKD